MDDAVQIIFNKFETSDTFESKINAFRECEQIVEFVRWSIIQSRRMYINLSAATCEENVSCFNCTGWIILARCFDSGEKFISLVMVQEKF